MRALVTGGGGFLGRCIVEQLLARGDHVRILARGAYPDLAARGVECLRGDLRRPQIVRHACAAVDTVFHVAALAGVWGRRDDFFSINVTGTRNVIDACRAGGVPRLVYTSSPSVVFGMNSLTGADESLLYPPRFYAHYPASKASAEQAVLAANGADGMVTCALRPHLIWGPRDPHIVKLLVDRARAGRLVQVGDGTNRVDLTYVENAARAHLQAAAVLAPDSAVAGQAYFISDAAPVNLWGWVREFLARADLPPVRRRLPYAAAYALGGLMELAWRALPLGGEPLLTRFVACQFATSHYFDVSKAERDFGYRPVVGNDEGVARTVAWLRDSQA